MLTEGPIARRMFFFTLPILAGNVLQSLSGSVNAMWIGRYLGNAALTASTNANTVLFFLIGSMFGLGMATTIFVGQALGKQDVAQAKRVIGTSALFFGGLGLSVALFGSLLTEPLLRLMRTPPDALPLATAYLRVIFAAMPFIYLYTLITMSLRGAGDSKTPFYFLILSVALDAALNPLFIFGFGPVPRMGIAGSAFATLISTGTSMTALMFHLYRTKHVLWMSRSDLGFLRLDRDVLRLLIAKGVPMGLQMVVISLSLVATIGLVNHFGSLTTAAYGASFQMWNYIQMPAFAVGQAVTSMAAQNVGAGRWDRIDGIAWTGVGFNVALTGTLVAAVYLFSGTTLGLFLRDPQAIDVARHVNAIAVWSFLLMGASMVLGGVMRSTGAVIPPLVILVVAFWGVRFPFAWLMQGTLAADAIWWSFPVGGAVSVVLTMAYYRFGRWRQVQVPSPPLT
jgi:putative MATE family efflux protein